MVKFKTVRDKITELELLKESGRIDVLNNQLLSELKILISQLDNLPNDEKILEIAQLRSDNMDEQVNFLHGAIYIRDVVLVNIPY